MDLTTFIKPSQFTQYGFTHGNVEEDVIQLAIFRVQETQIQPLLGSPLFNKLKALIEAGPFSGVYYDLMIEYVLPALIPLAEIKLTFHLTSEIENKGVGRNSDQYMRSNTTDQNNNLRDELRKDANHFSNQLIRFLCDDNGENYPEYLERTGAAVDFKPEGSGPTYLDQISII